MWYAGEREKNKWHSQLLNQSVLPVAGAGVRVHYGSPHTGQVNDGW